MIMLAALFCMPLFMPPEVMVVRYGGRVVELPLASLQRRARQLGIVEWRHVYGAWVRPLDTVYIAKELPQVCREAILRHEMAHRAGWTHPGTINQE